MKELKRVFSAYATPSEALRLNVMDGFIDRAVTLYDFASEVCKVPLEVRRDPRNSFGDIWLRSMSVARAPARMNRRMSVSDLRRIERGRPSPYKAVLVDGLIVMTTTAPVSDQKFGHCPAEGAFRMKMFAKEAERFARMMRNLTGDERDCLEPTLCAVEVQLVIEGLIMKRFDTRAEDILEQFDIRSPINAAFGLQQALGRFDPAPAVKSLELV